MKNTFILLIGYIIVIIIYNILLKKFINIKDETNYFFLEGNTMNFVETFVEEKEKIYVSIDFGNHETRFAYNIGNNINTIRVGNMRDCPSIIILYKSNFTAKNYGLKSIHSISNYNKDELNEIIYVDNLKLNMFNKKVKEAIKDENIINIDDYKRKAIIEFLRLFSNDALEEINSNIKNEKNKYKKEEINWIITSPNLWDDISKLNLKEFAKEAGMNNTDLVIESEVAFIQYYYENNINNMNKGEIYMLIDLGEYIADISIFRKIDSYFEKISYPLGDTFGAMNINDDIINIIKDGLGKEIIENAKNNNFGKYLETLKDIEDIKKRINGNEMYKYEINAKYEKETRWQKFKSIFSKNSHEFIYNNTTINYDENKIYFPANVFIEIIEKRVNEIINYIDEIISKYKKIDHIILTGGFSNCNILKKRFLKRFHKIDIIINPNNNLIVKGAITYIINKKNNDFIKLRYNHNTYWIENYKTIQANETCKDKIKKNDNYYCP